jgi:hypothetical protein
MCECALAVVNGQPSYAEGMPGSISSLDRNIRAMWCTSRSLGSAFAAGLESCRATKSSASCLLLPRTVTPWYRPENDDCGETAELWAYSTSSSNRPDGSAWYSWAMKFEMAMGAQLTRRCEATSGSSSPVVTSMM